MILDNIRNSSRYNEVSPLFEKAFTFLKSDNLKDLPEGKYEIQGDDLFAIVAKPDGKMKDEALLEFHNKYIDIQYLLEGFEYQGWKCRADCTQIRNEYDESRDLGFFSDGIDNWITLRPGEFTVYFPEDAHAPAVSDSMLHKVIIKVSAGI